jgi:L-alanine-DL-glutamate epimerase-like enolase superfamily enzyme
VPIENATASAYRIPTDFPESDGTIAWNATTLVIVEIMAGGTTGLGYTYADNATATLIRDHLAGTIRGRDVMAIPAAWAAMVASVRNLGRPGFAAMAISAVDSALWDLKGKWLGLPLVTLLGAARDSAPVYGSGGFTSYSLAQLREQLGGWVNSGISRVRMKVGRDPTADIDRVKVARDAIGTGSELFVDANGPYSRKPALAYAADFVESGVTWFEEPVPSDDTDGLRLIRDQGTPGMEIAAGECGRMSSKKGGSSGKDWPSPDSRSNQVPPPARKCRIPCWFGRPRSSTRKTGEWRPSPAISRSNAYRVATLRPNRPTRGPASRIRRDITG